MNYDANHVMLSKKELYDGQCYPYMFELLVTQLPCLNLDQQFTAWLHISTGVQVKPLLQAKWHPTTPGYISSFLLNNLQYSKMIYVAHAKG